MNEDRTSPNSDTPLTQRRSPTVPTRYELIDKDGRTCGWFYSAGQAAQEAERLWPDQSQDEERSGRGWDVQLVGADR